MTVDGGVDGTEGPTGAGAGAGGVCASGNTGNGGTAGTFSGTILGSGSGTIRGISGNGGNEIPFEGTETSPPPGVVASAWRIVVEGSVRGVADDARCQGSWIGDFAGITGGEGFAGLGLDQTTVLIFGSGSAAGARSTIARDAQTTANPSRTNAGE